MIPPLLHIASRLRYDTVNRHLASTHLNLNRRVWSGLLVGASLLLWEGCALEKPEQEQRIGELGRFHFRPSENRMEGVIVGAPHGSAEPAAAECELYQRTYRSFPVADYSRESFGLR